ncbi:hypothetical protein GCM10022240_05000 [Microbacterium kribbense]|uniref:Peptidoglycan binding domain-containing protein n=1 Tax=Microbacterium kribbense TaxID=433645 RepID=A0ABP7G311_9MICO
MDQQGAVAAARTVAPAAGTVPVPDAPADVAAPGDAAVIPPRKSHLGRDLTLIVVVVGMLLAGLGVGGVFVYRALYSPAAFVQHYLELLAEGHAADALKVPGVVIDRSQLDAAGLPKSASEALLRQAALSTLTHISVTTGKTVDGVTDVTASYHAGGNPGTTTFQVRRGNDIGFVPTWRFARSPLAVVELTVHGAMQFQVNRFRVDKRQVGLAGAEVNPADPVPLLVFSPGLYSVRVDTPISYSPGVAVLSDAPLKNVPVTLQTKPTETFIAVVQNKVDDYLNTCAAQQVLQPSGCPFGYTVQNRIEAPPTWSIAHSPKVTVVPDGENWAILPTRADAHIVVDIREIYDGSLRHIDEDVPFTMSGTITVSPSGTASIRVSSDDDG